MNWILQRKVAHLCIPTTVSFSTCDEVTERVTKPYHLGLKKHATLDPCLDRILKTQIPVRRGKDGNDYYVPDFQIQARFFSAHSEYTLWFEDKNHGTVKVDYA